MNDLIGEYCNFGIPQQPLQQTLDPSTTIVVLPHLVKTRPIFYQSRQKYINFLNNIIHYDYYSKISTSSILGAISAVCDICTRQTA